MSGDFQLIAGTVRDLRQLVAEGKFREDLYARINLWTFTLPGLRQRRKILNLTWIDAERHASLTGDSVLTPKRGVPGWPLQHLLRRHGAVTFASFLPASRGWQPFALADASLWTWLKMR